MRILSIRYNINHKVGGIYISHLILYFHQNCEVKFYFYNACEKTTFIDIHKYLFVNFGIIQIFHCFTGRFILFLKGLKQFFKNVK